MFVVKLIIIIDLLKEWVNGWLDYILYWIFSFVVFWFCFIVFGIIFSIGRWIDGFYIFWSCFFFGFRGGGFFFMVGDKWLLLVFLDFVFFCFFLEFFVEFLGFLMLIERGWGFLVIGFGFDWLVVFSLKFIVNKEFFKYIRNFCILYFIFFILNNN